MSGAAPESEGWGRVRALVERVLAVPHAEREALLAAGAEGDSELLREARALLELEDREDAFADGSAGTPVRGALDPVARDGVGGSPDPLRGELQAGGGAKRVVGPYELHRELGAGGMGRVYLGVRADRAYHQRVAVKLLQFGADDPEVRERFRRERQVLANLDHPGIARLIDGGVAADGTPYLAMEYVEGVPLDRYCDENRLTLGERLRLFRKICDAVHDAHKNLVVHRDIKPSNVVVTPTGEPKLLDFGIAKVLDPEKSALEVDVTGPMMRFMTPAYASPEQLRGRPITTASDVYSLGVLLYKLLSGHLPHTLASRSALEIERIVCEEEPDRPSTAITKIVDLPVSERTPTGKQLTPEVVSNRRRTTPRHLKRSLAGDLDRVVMKALRKEPQRRYASAEQFSEDVRRYLDGLPVSARPDTRAYRTAKFLRRNRAPVTLAGLVLLALLGALSFSFAQYRRADEAAANEREQRELAVEGMGEARELALALEREKLAAVERLVEVESLNRELEHERGIAEDRLVELTELALTIVFDLHREIHSLEGATEATELALRVGLGAVERMDLEGDAGPELLRRLSGGYLRLGEVQGDPEVQNLGRTDAAVASFRRAFGLAQRALDDDPSDASNAFAYSMAAARLASMLAHEGEPEEEYSLRIAALEACESVPLEERLRNFGLGFLHHTLYMGLADAQLDRDQPEEALSSIDDAERALEEYLEANPRNQRLANARLLVATRRARILEHMQEYESALFEAELGLELAEAGAEERPSNGIARRQVRVAREIVGNLLLECGEGELAVDLFGANAEELEALLALEEENQQAWEDRFSTSERIAHSNAQLERWEEASQAARRGLEVIQRLAERGVPADRVARWNASMHWRLSNYERQRGRLLEAVDHAQQARRLYEDILSSDPEETMALRSLPRILGELGLVYLEMAEREVASDARRANAERAREWFTSGLEALDELEQRGILDDGASDLRANFERDLARCEARAGD